MLKNIFNRKEEEKRIQSEGRLPPGQSLTKKFPVLHYGPVPTFNAATWDFRVWGEVVEEVKWTWAEFQTLPRKKIEMDLHCVTRWSKFDTLWEGVSVKTLIDEGFIKLKPTAKHAVQHAEYGYTTNTPVETILQDNFLLATHFNGEPITPDHGYPLRGVIGAIPGRDDLKDVYLWKGAKWIRGIEFLSEDRMGFWERAGYHNVADVWKEERFARRSW
jgi:DMSO/TMAO reductase YedYZ molybdopterin-dependent catalytic subunit